MPSQGTTWTRDEVLSFFPQVLASCTTFIVVTRKAGCADSGGAAACRRNPLPTRASVPRDFTAARSSSRILYRALPRCPTGAGIEQLALKGHPWISGTKQRQSRSEERRVGKEWRSRWSP